MKIDPAVKAALLENAIRLVAMGSVEYLKALEGWLSDRVAGLTECAPHPQGWWRDLELIRNHYWYSVKSMAAHG